MPRLQGQSSKTGLYIVALILVLLAVLVALELLGILNLVATIGPA